MPWGRGCYTGSHDNGWLASHSAQSKEKNFTHIQHLLFLSEQVSSLIFLLQVLLHTQNASENMARLHIDRNGFFFIFCYPPFLPPGSVDGAWLGSGTPLMRGIFTKREPSFSYLATELPWRMEGTLTFFGSVLLGVSCRGDCKSVAW